MNALTKGCKLIIKNIDFLLILINIFLWPVISYIPNSLTLLICNVAEYSCVFILLVKVIIKIKNNNIVPLDFSVIFLFLYIVYSFLITLFLGALKIGSIKELAHMSVCFSIFYFIIDISESKKKVAIILISIIISVFIMFLSSLVYNLHSINNIVEAFTGGRYRLGNIENQANGYANFCITSAVCCILFYCLFKKRLFLYISFIPSLICVGTQSKKGIIICFLLSALALYFIFNKIKNKTIRFSLFTIIFIFIIACIIVLALKTDIFIRLLSFGDSSDASSFERVYMIKFALQDSSYCFLVGHGVDTFQSGFFRYYGSSLVFHSTVGNAFYSCGFIGVFLWIAFLVSIFKDLNLKKEMKLFVFLFILFQILNDLTAQIWNMPILFIPLGLFAGIKFNKIKNYSHIKYNRNELFYCVEI